MKKSRGGEEGAVDLPKFAGEAKASLRRIIAWISDARYRLTPSCILYRVGTVELSLYIRCKPCSQNTCLVGEILLRPITGSMSRLVIYHIQLKGISYSATANTLPFLCVMKLVRMTH